VSGLNSHHLQTLEHRIAPVRQRLMTHPVYSLVNSVPRLRCFMEQHVFAVWDFMSLLKSLQRHLTSVTVPWLPTGNRAARLINEIVLGEETDDDGRGGHTSHFELYLASMADCGADTAPALNLIERLRSGQTLREALQAEDIPASARQFMNATFRIIERGRPEEIAAAFTFGREDVIPEMFSQFVSGLCAVEPPRYERFRFYLDRHIHLDADDHGPKALLMLSALCGNDPACWKRAALTAEESIQARLELWDAVQASLVRLPAETCETAGEPVLL